MEKKWLTVKDFPNYEVSNYGEVKNIKKGNILKNRITEKGYCSVILYNGSINKSFRVHRLILSVFDDVSYSEHCLECNHKDEDKLNNRIDNLNWLTRKENMNWNNLHQRIKRSPYKYSEYRTQKVKEKLSKKIIGTSIIDNSEIYFDSINDAFKSGFNIGNISACCLGKRKKHKGYYWKFALNY
jgi:hypothetical protein